MSLGQVRESPREAGPSALDDPTARGLPRPLVPVHDIVAGGPPPDGIAPVDRPLFKHPRDIIWIRPTEPVLAFSLNGDERAYPVQVLLWHEIVNDTVAGVPVAITYCPLCNTALAFDRRVAGRVVSFGTSGKLYNSDLVAYDRQTRSLWVQLLGQAVAGRLTGTRLGAYPVQTVSWADWSSAHPGGWVLDRDTGHGRDYGVNPYPGYDDESSRPFLYEGRLDARYPPKARLVGI